MVSKNFNKSEMYYCVFYMSEKVSVNDIQNKACSKLLDIKMIMILKR